jgi:multidrug resistance protein, MATE family
MDRYVFESVRLSLGFLIMHSGQVVGLFVVGIGEYCVVWLGTDWDLEIKKGIERNREEAKNRRVAPTTSD